MSREWKPGDVALVEAGCWANRKVALRLADAWAHAGGVSLDNVGIVTPVRPLVVIDPEDRERVERVRAALEASHAELNGFEGLQAALRALVAEPQPEEPKATGAIVRDADEELWVRRRGGPWDCLNSPAGKDVLGWADLCRKYGPLTVLSEGYSGEGS